MGNESPYKLVGRGIYTPAEAAFYARVQTRLINRWFFGNKQGEKIFSPELELKDERVISFLDFVQMLAIRELRYKYKVPLQNIRDGIQEFQDRYGIGHPFAREHVAYLFQKTLYIRQRDESEDNIYTAVSGNSKGQYALRRVVEVYMQDLKFKPDGLVEFYTAFSRPYKNKVKKIVLHPEKRFGEPLVESCGITPQTLYEASITEGSIEAAADMYEVEPEDVDIACRYIDHLTPSTAHNIAA